MITFAFIAFYMALCYFNQLMVTIALAFIQSFPGILSSGSLFLPTMARLIVDSMDQRIGVILAVSAILSLLMYIFIWRLRKRDFISQCKLNRFSSVKDICMGTLLGFSANFVISLILVILTMIPLFSHTFAEYQQFISILSAKNLIPAFIGIGFLGPIMEEILFRGMISAELSELFSFPTVLILQGIIFGVYHGNVVQAAYAAILGFLFGYCSYKSNSLYPAIAAHIAMNSTSLLLTLPSVTTQLSKLSVTLVYFLASSIAFVCSFQYFLQKRSPHGPLSVDSVDLIDSEDSISSAASVDAVDFISSGNPASPNNEH